MPECSREPINLLHMSEETAPYRAPQHSRIRTLTLSAMKSRGERFSMLTSYDQYTASIFDEAGIEVLLIGDSAGNNVLGYDSTLPVTLDEMVMFTRAVSSSAKRALVVADLPFGSYQESPAQAFGSAARLMKEGFAQAVKLEGGIHMAPTIGHLTRGGVPVMGHLGFTPQSEHALGGFRVQGRGDAAAQLVEEAKAIEAAGAFAIVLEMVPAPVAKAVTQELSIPTIGIGAGADCDGQVLVWTDFAGIRDGRYPRFAKKFADLRTTLLDAAREYREEVSTGTFPAPEHSFES